MSYENWKDRIGTFEVMDVRGKKMDFFPVLKVKRNAAAAVPDQRSGRRPDAAGGAGTGKGIYLWREKRNSGRCVRAAGMESGHRLFQQRDWPIALFQAYKLIKNGEKQGKSREDICSAMREKFGEKNPEMQVLN